MTDIEADLMIANAEIKRLQAQLEATISGQETLQKALAASQRRADAAVEDLKYYLENNEENGVVYVPKFVVERIIKQRGPQEAEKGEAG